MHHLTVWICVKNGLSLNEAEQRIQRIKGANLDNEMIVSYTQEKDQKNPEEGCDSDRIRGAENQKIKHNMYTNSDLTKESPKRPHRHTHGKLLLR